MASRTMHLAITSMLLGDIPLGDAERLMFGAVMQITQSFAIADISIQLAGNPSVNYAGSTVVTHLLDYGTVRFEMGYASAIATILFLLMVGTNKIVQKVLRRVGE